MALQNYSQKFLPERVNVTGYYPPLNIFNTKCFKYFWMFPLFKWLIVVMFLRAEREDAEDGSFRNKRMIDFWIFSGSKRINSVESVPGRWTTWIVEK